MKGGKAGSEKARDGPRTDGIGVLDGVLIVDKSCVAAPTRVLDDGWIVVLDLVVEDLSLWGQRGRGDRWRRELSGQLVHADDDRPFRVSRSEPSVDLAPGLEVMSLQVVRARSVDLLHRALKRLAPLRVREVQRVHVELDRLIVLDERGGESQGRRRHDHVSFLLRILRGPVGDNAEGPPESHHPPPFSRNEPARQGTSAMGRLPDHAPSKSERLPAAPVFSHGISSRTPASRKPPVEDKPRNSPKEGETARHPFLTPACGAVSAGCSHRAALDAATTADPQCSCR